jgi:hypothetical protein
LRSAIFEEILIRSESSFGFLDFRMELRYCASFSKQIEEILVVGSSDLAY